MEFLKPTSDIGFKKVFGNQEDADITISFLNSILELKEGELITEVTIKDVTNFPEIVGNKMSFVDVSCTDQTGKKYIIEIQVIDEGDYIERSQYYASFMLASQLKAGQAYHELIPIVFVGVVSYDLLPDPEYISHHTIINSKTGTHSLRHIEFHFIELSKFTKTIDELVTIAEKWVYFIKQAGKLKQIPSQLNTPREMGKAFHILEMSKLSPEELEAYKAEEDKLRGKEGMMMVALAKGREEGLVEGEKKGRMEVARQMLVKKLEISMISDFTGLTVNEIKELAKKKN